MVRAFAVGIIWTLGLAGLFAAAVCDFKQRIIPNRLVALTAACGVVIRLLTTPRSLGWSVGIAATLLVILGLAARRQWIGGGDVKLIAAVTLLVPPSQVGGLLLAIAIGGGVLSCVYLYAHMASGRHQFVPVADGNAPVVLSRLERLCRRAYVTHTRHRAIPYGLAIFVGAAFRALTEATRWFYATF